MSRLPRNYLKVELSQLWEQPSLVAERAMGGQNLGDKLCALMAIAYSALGSAAQPNCEASGM